MYECPGGLGGVLLHLAEHAPIPPALPCPCTRSLQMFWEAFPAGSGKSDRTTYMFSYLDAQPYRPSMLDLYEEYCELGGRGGAQGLEGAGGL